MSPHRYSTFERLARILYRKFLPVPRSPWTAGPVKDICMVNLVPPEQLVSFFTDCIETLRNLRGDDIGNYLEFGVFNGNSIGSMFHVSKHCAALEMRLFGFDAFEGLPPGSEDEDDGVWKTGFYHCSFDDMKQCLCRRSVNPDDITWINGWYDQTLTSELAQVNNLTSPGIVFIDCDTYSSSKVALDFLVPLIKAPVIICLDDWKLNDLDVKGLGEYKSFNEFLEENPHLKATSMKSYNRKSRTFFAQPR